MSGSHGVATQRTCVRCNHRADYHNAFGTMPCAMCDCPRLRLPTIAKTPQVRAASKPRPPLAKVFKLYLADAKECETIANEILRQINYMRRNGPGDECRMASIAIQANKLAARAKRGRDRYEADYQERCAFDREAQGTVANQ